MLKKNPYLYEIPIFYFLLYGINILFLPDIPGYVGVPLHPFWAGVLLFGFRYGISAGVTSGVLSAVLYLTFAWFTVETYLFEDFTFYLLPGLFIVIGAIIGAGIQKYRTTVAALRKTNERLTRESKILKEDVVTLQEVNQALENRIVTRMTTLITLQEGAKRMESLDIDELYRSALSFVAKTLDAEEAALYLKTDEGWTLKESYGWKEYHRRPESFRMDEGITGMAGSRKKIVTIRDFLTNPLESAPDLMGDCLFAGPVFNGERGEVFGVISIQGMAFVNFNSATVNLFAFLLNWVSRAVGRTRYFKELTLNEIVDDELQVFSYRYFESRAVQEFSRSQTYYLPLSLGMVSIPGLSEISESTRIGILTAVSQVLKEACRDMDVVARNPDDNFPFVILFLTASQNQAMEMRRKILTHLERLDLRMGTPSRRIMASIGLSSFTPQTKTFEELLTQAKDDLSHAIPELQSQSV